MSIALAAAMCMGISATDGDWETPLFVGYLASWACCVLRGDGSGLWPATIALFAACLTRSRAVAYGGAAALAAGPFVLRLGPAIQNGATSASGQRRHAKNL